MQMMNGRPAVARSNLKASESEGLGVATWMQVVESRNPAVTPNDVDKVRRYRHLPLPIMTHDHRYTKLHECWLYVTTGSDHRVKEVPWTGMMVQEPGHNPLFTSLSDRSDFPRYPHPSKPIHHF
jgi:hypothetical protein